MFAYVQNANAFTAAEVPVELQAKRNAADTRAEKKQAAATTPKQVNKSALVKKIKAQLDGITLLEQLTQDLVRIGIGNMNAKSAQQIEARAKQLGDAYLPGAQAALHAYTHLFFADDGKFDDKLPVAARESIYSEALDQLARIHAIAKQGRTYLDKRLADPGLKPETDSSIAAWLGHAWQLSELRDAGLTVEGAQLMQLAFNSHDDVARREFIDTGIWIDLDRGTVYNTKHYRPYKAVKHMKAEDSFLQVAQVPQLCIYPGDMNPRVRWDAMLGRPTEPQDFVKIRQAAHFDFAALIKSIKGNLKGPLLEKQPVCLLNFKHITMVSESFVVEDASGNRLTMTDRGMSEEPPSLQLLRMLPSETLSGQTLVVRFRHDLDTRRLEVKPLSILAGNELIRLTL